MAEVQLTPAETAFVEGCVTAGRYRTAADVVSAGLRLLQRAEARERMQALLRPAEEDLAAGRVHELDEVLADLDAVIARASQGA